MSVTPSSSSVSSPSTPPPSPVWWDETKRMVELSVPTIIINLGFFMPQAITASFVGRYIGTIALDGFTLGNLIANLFTLSILWGLSFANDTLSPQAFGANNYREVGQLAVRGFVCGTVAIVPANIILFFFLEHILLFTGQPAGPSAMAAQFYRVYMVGLPFLVLYVMVWKFLAAQEITKPLVLVFVFNCAVVLPLSLWFFVDWLGLIGAAVALALFMLSESVLLIAYLVVFRPHHPETWGGLSQWREALAWGPVKAYLLLGLGGILASSEWWFWEVLVLIVGTFGVVPLSVETIAVQVISVLAMIPLGVAIAMSVRIGNTITRSAQYAKKIAFWTYVVSLLLYLLLAVVLYIFRWNVILLFTVDPVVLQVSLAQCVGLV